MDKRILGVTLGVAGIFLWFMPFFSWKVEFMGVSSTSFLSGHISGQHIGGISYLLLFSMFTYSAFSWLKLHQLRIIAGALFLLICILFLAQIGLNIEWELIGLNIEWGLIGLTIISSLSLILAIKDHMSYKKDKN